MAARPLRRRNFTRIEIDRHLVQVDGAYQLRFEGSETKTGEPIETPFPIALVPQLERYLTEFRPFLLGRTGRESERSLSASSLWISVHGVAMTEIGIYFAISQLTRKRFGHVVSPHMFRDSAATSIAIEDPEHVHIVRSVLGHSSRTRLMSVQLSESLRSARRPVLGSAVIRRRYSSGWFSSRGIPEVAK